MIKGAGRLSAKSIFPLNFAILFGFLACSEEPANPNSLPTGGAGSSAATGNSTGGSSAATGNSTGGSSAAIGNSTGGSSVSTNNAAGMSSSMPNGGGGTAGELPLPPPKVVDIFASPEGRSCARFENKTIACWNPTRSPTVAPAVVPNLNQVATVAVGYDHTCVLLEDKTVWCWGENAFGQLGNGTTDRSTTPVPVSDLSNVVEVAAGDRFTCAIDASGMTKCWGQDRINVVPYLGPPSTGVVPRSAVPLLVEGATNAIHIAAGGSHACIVVQGGQVKCWGSNGAGELGTSASKSPDNPIPGNVLGLTDAKSLALGEELSCALQLGGTVSCWGFDVYGQLGDGQAGKESFVTQNVVNVTNATAVRAGKRNACAILADAKAVCWGLGSGGILGNQSANVTNPTPVAVTAFGPLTAIALGHVHTLALQQDGRVRQVAVTGDPEVVVSPVDVTFLNRHTRSNEASNRISCCFRHQR